mmetsp:Transcript_11743/g.30652  ORF Transcript_11743/g.30652 Transcript_11743/m.30652 type:complete len:271 (+) Transcript_11743:165-977(+)
MLQHLRVHLLHHLRDRRRVHVAHVRLLAHLLILLHRLLHGGLHDLKLLEELHHLDGEVPGASRDAVDPRRRGHDVLGLVELRVSHRVHDGHPPLDPLARLAKVEPLHPRERVHDVGERPHLHHRLELLAHVAQRPLPRREPLHHLGALKVDVRLLHALHQPRDVPLAQQPRHERLHLEVLKVVDVLARADVYDRSVGRCDRRERAAALRVAVELGDDHRADLDLLLEGLGLVVRRLADRRVHHKHNVVRLRNRGDLLHLLEERPLLPVSA